MCWQYTGSNAKSGSEFDRLQAFLKDPSIDPSLLGSISHEQEKKNIEKYLHTKHNPFNANHGWKISSVPIKLPHEQSQWSLGEANPAVLVMHVNGVHHHDITDIIVTMLQDSTTSGFHFTPFEEYWQHDTDSVPIRVYGEVYISLAHLDAHRKVNSLPHGPEDKYECIVVPLMFWSDTIHLQTLATHFSGRSISSLATNPSIHMVSQAQMHAIMLHTYPLCIIRFL